MDAQQNNSNGRPRGRFERGPTQTSVSSLFERQPPQSLEAEMSLLGSMILDPAVIPNIISLIKGPEDFYKEAHNHIYKAVLDVYDQRHSGDLVQFVDLLRDRNVIDQIGGP